MENAKTTVKYQRPDI